jgi:pyruvate formate lyase activating enzyme
MFYKKLDNKKVLCSLCPHNCIINDGETGICNVRKNKDGILYSINYAKVTSLAMDPIEKKPLNRFYPGKSILSLGTFGCNFSCPFCQNCTIATQEPYSEYIESEKVIDLAMKQDNCIGIAFTYNEPSIWYEYVYETSKLSKAAGLKNVLVTNGYINKEPLEKLIPYIDAVNIDVKAFDKKFYKDLCNGNLEYVKKSVEICSRSCHVEITTLIIPELNDNIDDIEKLSIWISNINNNIPLHLSRFFPRYKMREFYPTPIETLKSLYNVTKKHLKYVYLGNI